MFFARIASLSQSWPRGDIAVQPTRAGLQAIFGRPFSAADCYVVAISLDPSDIAGYWWGMPSIGERIRTVRRRRRMSAGELAAASGITANHVYVIERGEKSPLPETLDRIAAALHVPLRVLTRDA